MAIVFRGHTRCSLCFRILEEGERIVSVQHIFVPPHRFAPQSDTAMHQACFLGWDKRDEFRAAHDAFWKENAQTPWAWHMLEDGSTVRVERGTLPRPDAGQ